MVTESKRTLQEFPRYFAIRPAVSLADQQKTFWIRYRVYCEEFCYEPADRFPDHMEQEDLDEISSHCLISHIATGRPAGCVRVVPASLNGSRRPLPLEKCCSASLDPAAMARVTAPRDMICEASRFAVDGAFRRRSGEALTRFGEIASLDLSHPEQRTFPFLSVALMLAGTAMAELLGRPHMFAVMEPFLPRLLRRSGMVFDRMGNDVDHHGIRAVYLSDTREFVRNLDGDLQTFYQWIHQQLQDIAAGSPRLTLLEADAAAEDRQLPDSVPKAWPPGGAPKAARAGPPTAP